MKEIIKKIQIPKMSYRVYILLLAVFGIMMSIMIPTWQTPDEYTHLQLISESLGNEHIAENLVADMPLDIHRILGNQEEKLDVQQWKTAITASPSYARSDVMPGAIHISVIKHLPAIIGMLIGLLLHLPTFWVMQLAEVCSLAVYLFICWQAIKIMPFKKEIMMIFMVFPMSVQQGASINYDSLVIPLCFYVTAYIFYMAYDVETIGWKQVGMLLFVLLLLAYLKLPYILFGLLIFIVPRNKIKLPIGKRVIDGDGIHKYRWLMIAAFVLLVIAGGYVLRNNTWIQMLTGLALEPKRTLYLLYTTARTFYKYVMVSSVGNLAWLDTPMPMWFVLSSYILLVILALRPKREVGTNKIRAYQIVVLWMSFIIMCVFIVFSMVNHTIMMTLYGWEYSDQTYNLREALYMIPYIGGIQGRYFLPFIPLPFLATGPRNVTIDRIKIETKEKSNTIVVLYLLITAMITAVMLYHRFWIA